MLNLYTPAASEVRTLVGDAAAVNLCKPTDEPTSAAERAAAPPPFWIMIAALNRFLDNGAKGILPLEVSISNFNNLHRC